MRFSAEDPDSLRGPQFSAAWADEFCAWGSGGRKAGETLALLRMGLRLPGPDGAAPRLCVTTTPRATPDLKALRAEPGLAETHRTTAENAAWLAPGFVEGLERLYGGTRKAAQELEGRVVELDGGLWSEAMLEACPGAPPDRFERVVVAVDPTTTAGGHACGIVVAGKAGETAWVLADRSCAGLTPGGWAEVVAGAIRDFDAQCVVVEVNQGGTMVA